ncbi:MAG: ATP-binding protein [Fibrobacter sp.]|nr:ATP-binding protein [Fibrobacter sp.]
MNIDTVCKQLQELHMATMAEQLQQRLANGDHKSLSHEEFIALLVEDEYLAKKQKRMDRIVCKAGFKPEKPAIEDIIHSDARGISHKDILQFTNGKWIEDARNIILTGPTGCGKSFIAQAIALQACRMGYITRYLRYTMLFEEIAAAKGTGQYLKLLKSLSSTRVLIIDDFLMHEVTVKDLTPLMEIIEEKQQTGSIIITTQYPIVKWHHRMPDPTMADAICDRLTSNAYKFNMKGEQSMRIKTKKSQDK